MVGGRYFELFYKIQCDLCMFDEGRKVCHLAVLFCMPKTLSKGRCPLLLLFKEKEGPDEIEKKALHCIFFAQAIKRVWDPETKIIKGRGFIALGGRSVCAAAIATTDPERVFFLFRAAVTLSRKSKTKKEKQENLRDW